MDAPGITRRRAVTERLLNAPHVPIAAYLAFIGITAMLDPDAARLARGQVPDWFLYSWAGPLVVGGMLVVGAVLVGRSRAESAGHGFCLAGMATFAAAAIIGQHGEARLAVVLAVLAGVSLIRMRQLSQLREGRAVARRVLHGGSH